MRRLGSHLGRHVVGYLALFVALGGTSYGVATGSIDSREIKNNAVRGKDVRNGTISSRDVGNGRLLARDFAAGELPRGATGPEGPRGLQGAAGATNVRIRLSGEGTAGAGAQPPDPAGGQGGSATCIETGCLLAKGGAGGHGGAGGNGGNGGNADCGAIPDCVAGGGNGGNGGSTGDVAQPGEGAAVGLRASCADGERAVAGGVRGGGRDALVYRSHPATGTTTDPAAGTTPTAWYIEVYNQSRAGENRDGVGVTARAYVICAAP